MFVIAWHVLREKQHLTRETGGMRFASIAVARSARLIIRRRKTEETAHIFLLFS
ncbi:MAG TPA: hypothetical protein VJ698_10815 [Noviherbaspirillum sp.]|uniref:hypothetical protein n=1 Tax=Noviherbaspirillum sp. TaxID=1926288 RepID=UPI002B4A4370|nr:hypothetical protein [Noviherbaspirillum sp.]HJV85957.1 hypothetical protein [Noviherbaspirillum sp.]